MPKRSLIIVLFLWLAIAVSQTQAMASNQRAFGQRQNAVWKLLAFPCKKYKIPRILALAIARQESDYLPGLSIFRDATTGHARGKKALLLPIGPCATEKALTLALCKSIATGSKNMVGPLKQLLILSTTALSDAGYLLKKLNDMASTGKLLPIIIPHFIAIMIGACAMREK